MPSYVEYFAKSISDDKKFDEHFAFCLAL